MSLRPWQEELINVCRTNRSRQIIVRAVPAAGKGSVPYLVVAYTPRSLVQAVCHVVPRLNLRTQSESPPKWLANHITGAGLPMPTMRAADNITPFRRGADGYAICWDSIRNQPDLHKQEFDLFKYALIIDEPQMLPNDGSTKRALSPLVDRCSLLVMMSGTFERGDQGPIAFLPYKQAAGGEVIDYEADGWTTIRYSRSEALTDKAILPLEFTLRDARAKFIKGAESRQFESFSELQTEQEQRAGLYAVVSDGGGWEIAKEMIEAWIKARKALGSTQALIITHSQAAAKNYRDQIKANYAGIDVRIAISDEPGSESVLKNFRNGKGDILITVGMAYVGFDAPRISHIALLTYIRVRAWIEQAVSRGVRVDERYPYQAQRCVVFAPNDPLLAEIVRAIEAEQEAALRQGSEGPGGGGGLKDQTVVIDVALTSTQAHEINIAKLTPELTQRYAQAIEHQGLAGTALQLHRAIGEAFGAEQMSFSTSAPIIGISEQEQKLRGAIETRCRRTDAIRQVSFGTTNSDMRIYFGLSRVEMSLEQLVKALAWLDRTYPLP